MKAGFLSEYFKGVVVKRLVPGEVDVEVSHQREFNASKEMKQLFGNEKIKLQTTFFYIDDAKDTVTTHGMLTWYDARAKHPTRSEFRLFYSSTDVMRLAEAGNVMFIGLRHDGTALVIVSPQESTACAQLCWLFGVQPGEKFTFRMDYDGADMRLAYTSRILLEELGIETDDERTVNYLDEMLDKFKHDFPTTKEFSEYARSKVKMDGRDDADIVLMAWFNMEEALFKVLEKYLIDQKLKEGFASTEDFIKYSLSVQNRRKSRAGLGLENHLEEMFMCRNLHYSRTPVTENKSKPDFIFPSITAYFAESYPNSRLLMLGSKSTCKDRWRQVLKEADKIEHKHLITLEPAISVNQTNEMQADKLQLVVPREIQVTYTPDQREWLMDFDSFLQLVKKQQS